MSTSALPIMMSLFGSAYSATAQVRAGGEAADVANYNASVADANARAKGFEASDSVQRGYVAETMHRQDVKKFIGSQRVILAASGQDLTSGTASDLQADTAKQGELDALAIRTNAAREAWGYKTQEYNYSAQAEDLRRQAAIAKQKGKQGAVQTILTDASTILYQKYGKT